MSHPIIILTKIREKLRPMYKEFISRYMMKVKMSESLEFICYEDFKNLLNDLLREAIVEHEIVTLCRHFAIETKKSPRVRREEVRSIVQGKILRDLWDDLERTKEFILHFSP